MLWLTWRQFRVQALTTGALLAAFTIGLLTTGIQLRNRLSAAGLPGCHAHHICEQAATGFINQLQADRPYSLLFNAGVVVLYVVPGLIGLFWGAPLIAREFETGTYRVAWNQSVTRNRWLANKLGFIGLTAMVTTGLFSLLYTWWASPIDQALSFAGPNAGIGLNRLDPTLFGASGIAPLGYAAFALVLGVTFGVLIRRTLPAMAATLAVFAAIQVAWPTWIRPHLISPAVARVPLGTNINEFMINGNGDRVTILGAWQQSGAWVLSDKTITPAGHIFTGPATSACLQGTQQQCNAWVASKDLRQLVTFQPASRFWAFQWYETAIFVLVAVALACFCAWRIRRRRLT
jgi:hypothetical protein